MQFVVEKKFAKAAFMALEGIVFLFLVGRIAATNMAERAGKKEEVASLQRAASLDPGNSDYHYMLGRLYKYSLTQSDPVRAFDELSRAAALNPIDPFPWLEMATTLEFQGKTREAETLLRRADFLAPSLPQIQWSIGNFFLLHGNIDDSFRALRVVLTGTSEYDQIVFDIGWKATGDGNRILAQLIPNHLPTEISYINYLAAHQKFEEARAVWNRLGKENGKIQAAQASDYLELLIQAQRPVEANQVWSELISKGVMRSVYQRTDENLIANGNFEDDLLNIGFAWRVFPRNDVYAGLEEGTFHSPSHALYVQFSGGGNIEYRQVFQYVLVAPGKNYRLRGFLKTEGITTDSGPRLEVRDVYNPAALEKLSEDVQGTSLGWKQVILDFTTGPKTELIAVGLSRFPSNKFDNLIAGKVWMDDLSLVPLSGEPSSGP